ncbi:MAG: S41 family peptidase, partial [bacterium]
MPAKTPRYILFLLGIFAGIVIYSALTPSIAIKNRETRREVERLAEVLDDIDKYYVEDVDAHVLVDGAIRGMLETLDPHTTYIPEEHFQRLAERFEGHFDGIGIEFIIQDDYPVIVSPIPDTPSDRLGLRAGDKIIEIENESTFQLTSDAVMNRLRGKRGTVVNIKVRREQKETLLPFAIRRDKIALNSVIAAFMLNDETGLIKLTHFAKTTEDEINEALAELKENDMQQLILDLRGNTGGFLDQAVAVANKFIPAGKKIVFTRGRIQQANEEYFASEDRAKTDVPLIVLMSHGSASASEIVAGAIQDWDRGLIIGETSFGKGLVQNQLDLIDGAAIRITIARYYTPSGRLIQRPYLMSRDAYYEVAFEEHDSTIILDSTKTRYFTESGREVYSDGGISPDVHIEWQSEVDRFLSDLLRNRLFFEYASQYAAKNRHLAQEYAKFFHDFQVSFEMESDFKRFVLHEGIKFSGAEWQKNRDYIKAQIKSEIARYLWNSEKYYEIWLSSNKHLKKAISHFAEAAQ